MDDGLRRHVDTAKAAWRQGSNCLKSGTFVKVENVSTATRLVWSLYFMEFDYGSKL